MSRTVEREIAIQAPPDAVWKALTEAEELARWFPLEARTRPGVGGSIWMRWGETYQAESGIEVWEPARHLRIAFPIHGSMRLATDYYLEGKGGGTVLRVVTSGFGAGEDWDDMYAGVDSGWAFELQGLRHYLERHRGKNRLVAWAVVPWSGDRAERWRRLTGPGGWFGSAGLPAVRAGERYTVTTSTGESLSGTVQVHRPGQQFAATVDGWNDGLFRLELEGGDRKGTGWLWLATYGIPERDVRALERRWKESLDSLLAA